MALSDPPTQNTPPLRARRTRASIKNRASIHDRPDAVANREETGHWEADLIICKRTRPVLVLHERNSRVTPAARSGRAQVNDLRQRYHLRPA